MQTSGIVRRADDLGRVIIPRAIRNALGIAPDDPLEIYFDKKAQSVIFKKYIPEDKIAPAGGAPESRLDGELEAFIDDAEVDRIIAALNAQKNYRDMLRKSAQNTENVRHAALMAQLSNDNFLHQIDRIRAIAQAAMDVGVDISDFRAGQIAPEGGYVGFIFTLGDRGQKEASFIGYLKENEDTVLVTPERRLINGYQIPRVGAFVIENRKPERPDIQDMEHFLDDWPRFRRRFMEFINRACEEFPPGAENEPV